MKFPRSIRWRFLAWLAFLLAAVLVGFGVTAWEFFRVSQDARPDPELEKRVRTLAAAVDRSWPGPRGGGERRPGPPPGGPQGMPGGPGGPPREQGAMPPRDGGPGGPPPDESGDPRGGRMEGAGPVRPMWPAAPGGPPPNEPGPPPSDDSHGAAATPAAASEGSTIRVGPRTVAIGRDVLSLFEGSAGWYWAVWSRDRALTRSTAQVPDDLPRPSAGGGYQTRRRDGWREAWIFNGVGECILVGRPDVAETVALRRFTWSLVAVGAGVLALALGGGWWIVGRALRPVDEISAAAGRIAEGDLAERIPLAQTDGELGRLAGVLNSTFARLEAAFARQRRLTADAAHELRTPVAVLLSETQATLARPRTAEEYRETVEECLAVARQMRRLTESLLDLARLDAGPEAVTRSSMDLATVAGECANLLRSLAEEKEIELACDLAPARVRGDAHRLGQVATNLLSNALHYNHRGGRVRVRTGAQNGHAVLEVSDTGPGIAPEDLPHIFERFWRADPARGRDDGRTGLGLAIAKAVAEAHGGSLEAESEPGTGAVFTLRLPAVK